MPSFHHDLFDAVAFDFDGTLADTEKAHMEARLRAYEELAVELDKPHLATVAMEIHAEAHHHGSDSLSMNAWVLEQIKESTTLAKTIAARKTENYHSIAKAGMEALPGAVDFVKLARKRWGDNIFIVTTAYRDQEVVPFLARYGLRRAFRNRQLITREDVKTIKPSPEAYRLLLGKLALSATPERLLVVEDTPNGVESARGAGAMVAGLVKEGDLAKLTEQENFRRADEFVNNFEELADIVGIA
jgi:beta-phosphoglucomutase